MTAILPPIRTLLLAGSMTLACIPAHASDFGEYGLFAGAVSAYPTPADYDAYVARTWRETGQKATVFSHFIDYNQGIANWVTSATYNIGKTNSSVELDGMVPFVSVGLADSPTGMPGGVYNNAASVAMMNAVAAGTYDHIYNGIITAYKNAGFPKIYLRIAWEQNGRHWNPWYALENPATTTAYLNAWKHVANLAHAATGIKVLTVWSPALGNNGTVAAIQSTYPTSPDTYVDIIAPDMYSRQFPVSLHNWDGTNTNSSTVLAWQAIAANRQHGWDYPQATPTNPTAGYGLIQAMADAVSHNKPFGFSEVGAGNKDTEPNYGPVDEGLFPIYLANRLLASCANSGMKLAFINIWNTQEWVFSNLKKPKDKTAWAAFVNMMAGDTVKQAESLSATSNLGSGAFHNSTDTGIASGNSYCVVNTAAAGDYLQFTVPVSQTGTYSIKVRVRKMNNRGIFQLSIDGSNQGTAQDIYNADSIYEILDLGFKTFTTTGNHTFKFAVTGKNPASTGHSLAIDYLDISFRPVEVEKILTVSANRTITSFSDSLASGGIGERLDGIAVNDYVQYSVPVVKTGTYQVKLRVKKNTARGIFQLAVDGVNVGTAQDLYASADAFVTLSVGSVTFTTTGPKTFKFTVVGKNAASSSYTVALDSIELQ